MLGRLEFRTASYTTYMLTLNLIYLSVRAFAVDPVYEQNIVLFTVRKHDVDHLVSEVQLRGANTVTVSIITKSVSEL